MIRKYAIGQEPVDHVPSARGAALTTPFSYPEVGATRGELPDGYRHTRIRRILGHGEIHFEEAAERLLTWQMHRRAGLRIETAAPRVVTDAVATIRIGWRALSIAAPVRVVYTVDEPGRRGFAYGTLPRHPEAGEELFLVHLDDDGTVRGEIRAFSRPGRRLTRLGGPVARRLQDVMTERYLDALLTDGPSTGSGND